MTDDERKAIFRQLQALDADDRIALAMALFRGLTEEYVPRWRIGMHMVLQERQAAAERGDRPRPDQLLN